MFFKRQYGHMNCGSNAFTFIGHLKYPDYIKITQGRILKSPCLFQMKSVVPRLTSSAFQFTNPTHTYWKRPSSHPREQGVCVKREGTKEEGWEYRWHQPPFSYTAQPNGGFSTWGRQVGQASERSAQPRHCGYEVTSHSQHTACL